MSVERGSVKGWAGSRVRPFAYGVGVALASAGVLLAAKAQGVAVPKSVRPPGGSVSGTIRIAGSLAPALEATVTLRSVDTASTRDVVTDGGGHFKFDNLTAGRALIHVSKPGYIPANYGAKSRGTTGVILAIKDNEITSNIDVVLARGATLSGKVTGETGAPVVGARVLAVERALSEQGTHWLRAAVATSDDNGSYRLFGLAGGDYAVVVLRNDLGSGPISPIVPRTGRSGLLPGGVGSQEAAYEPVFYPGSSSPLDMKVVNVHDATDLNDVNIVFRSDPGATVFGKVIVPAAASASSLKVSLAIPLDSVFSALGFPRLRSAAIGSGGRFELRAVPKGDFAVAATATDQQDARAPKAQSKRGPSWFASAVASVKDERLVGLDTLQLGRTASVVGRVVLDKKAGPATLPPDSVMVRLSSAGESAVEIPAVRTAPDWTVHLSGVPPGRYVIATGLRTSPQVDRAWHLKVVTVNGKDATDTPADIGTQSNEDQIIIELTNQLTELNGTVLGPQGPTSEYYLVVFPDDPQLWKPGSRWLRAPGRPATDGSYRLIGLPPGRYRIAAVDDYDPSRWWSAAFLSSLVTSSIQVSLGDGEVRTQNIAVGRGGMSKVAARVRSWVQLNQILPLGWPRQTVQARGLTRDPWR